MSAERKADPDAARRAQWQAIRAAARRLPNAECDGCTAGADRCAGDVPMTRYEYEQIVAVLGERAAPPRPSHRPEEMAAPCRFLDGETRLCLIYPVRPLACRLFGLTPWWPCPAGRFGPKVLDADGLLEPYCELPRAPFATWHHGGDASDPQQEN